MPEESSTGERARYRLPPSPIPEILDAPPPPALLLSPDRRTLAWLGRAGLPPLSELAEPELRLAGVRINPRTNGRSREGHLLTLAFGALDGGTPRPAATPAGVRISHPRWAPDSRHLAFLHTAEAGLELWVAETATGRCRRIAGPGLNAAFGRPYSWMPDGESLLVNLVPPGRGGEPSRPAVPEGPIVFESYGRTAPTRTYQDLLDSPHAERLFEHYFTGQLVRIGLRGEQTPIGEEGIISGFAPSPSGELILVERIHRPFSYLVPYHRFPTEVRVVDTSGALVRDLADLPLAEEVPVAFDAVPAGPRGFHWRSDAPAELVWVEALDGGDPRVQAEARDRVMVLRAMDGEPQPLIDLEHRFAGVHWGNDDVALLYTRWWVTRTERRILIRPGSPESPPVLVGDRSYQDVYHDPGWPVTTPNAAGKLTLMLTGAGRSIYLAGEGASPRGSYPFLDRLDLDSGSTERIWQCEDGVYEQVAALLDTDAERILTRRESPMEPPNYHLRDRTAGTMVQVTDFPDPAPQLAGIRRQLITYTRSDGVGLNATLITPPGYDPERDGPLPLLVWAYPREFRDAGDAGQVDDSPNRFSRPAGASHLFLLTQGYAVLDGPTMPIIGEGEVEPNDSYVAQLVASAQAAVGAVVGMGVADPERVAVGGHSYGAFMTANLLAHTELFRAGIARSGAYNRTLTPFGFQQEQRTYWEAAETYHRMSPFTHADRLRAPILLIHGEADNNTGTHPLQSERFYHALKGHGATVRYVVLPHESHAYRARESVLHTLAEMVEWLGKWLGTAPPSP